MITLLLQIIYMVLLICNNKLPFAITNVYLLLQLDITNS